MHAPDGFLNVGTAVATGAISLGAVTVATRQASKTFKDKQVPLAGVTAAFVFAGQMFNFPVAAGTTGHLLGGALAAILLGPYMGTLAVTVVVLVQALIFADGGLTALGYNTLNMAIVPAFGGYVLFRLFRYLFPANASGVAAATTLASGLSVVLASLALSVEWFFGATAPVPFSTVLGSMVGVHTLIGIGEAVISGVAISAVLAARPDLVAGARDLQPSQLSDRTPVTARTLLFGGIAVAFFLAIVVSQFAADAPDGLEKVAADYELLNETSEPDSAGTGFWDYTTPGVSNEVLSLGIAGGVGVAVTAVLSYALFRAVSSSQATSPPSKSMSDRLYVPGTSALHRMAPEAKIVAGFCFVSVVAVTPRHFVGVFLLDFAVVLVLMAWAKFRVRQVVTRLLAVLPFVAFAFLIPLLAEGEQVSLAGVSLSVEGLWGAWGIIAKATLGAGSSILLAGTTQPAKLLQGLTRLRVPKVFTATIVFMLRYLDVVVDEMGRMRSAMTARGYHPRWLWQAKPVALSAGSMFVRSYERGERIHGAMLARGFIGVMPDSGGHSADRSDWFQAAVCPSIAAVGILVGVILT